MSVPESPRPLEMETAGTFDGPEMAGLGPLGQSSTARPRDPAEVGSLIRRAAECGLTVTPTSAPRAGAPGLTLDLSGLDRIVELRANDMLAVVQAGVRLVDLEQAAVALGLSYPPAMLASRRETVGGSLARNARGRTPRSGPSRDYVLGLRVATADGRVLDLGSRAIKNATGYNLSQLIVGSWGALAAILEATIRLVRLGHRRTVLASFADLPTATESALALCRHLGPVATELLDARLGLPDVLNGPADQAGAALLALVEADDPAEADSRAAATAGALASGASQSRVLDPAEAERGWNSYRDLRDRLDDSPGQISVAVPLAETVTVVREARRLAERQGVEVAFLGEVGSGVIGCALLGGRGERARSLLRDLLGLARKAGGQCLESRGLGNGSAETLDLILPPEVAASLRQVKAALDPRDTLRPAHW